MSNITISLNSLVKSNNGLFKSEKQAAFVLSQLVDGQHFAMYQTYNNQTATIFDCDSVGVLSVTKQNTVKGQTVFTKVWDRVDTSVQQAIVNKAIAKHDKVLNQGVKNAIKALEEYEVKQGEFVTYSNQVQFNRAVRMHSVKAGVSPFFLFDVKENTNHILQVQILRIRALSDKFLNDNLMTLNSDKLACAKLVRMAKIEKRLKSAWEGL